MPIDPRFGRLQFDELTRRYSPLPLMLTSPLSYAVYPWSVHCKRTLMQKQQWIYNYLHFRYTISKYSTSLMKWIHWSIFFGNFRNEIYLNRNRYVIHEDKTNIIALNFGSLLSSCISTEGNSRAVDAVVKQSAKLCFLIYWIV